MVLLALALLWSIYLKGLSDDPGGFWNYGYR